MKISVVSPESVYAAVSFLRQANDILDSCIDETKLQEIISQMRHAKRLIEHAMLELTSEEVQGG